MFFEIYTKSTHIFIPVIIYVIILFSSRIPREAAAEAGVPVR